MKEQIEKAVEVLRRGGVILYPTDTVWGLGCDAANGEAVERIYRLKHSHDKKGMLILAGSPDMAARYTSTAPEVAWQLFEMADKPLTLILPGAAGVAENLVPEEKTIGIRIPRQEFCQALLRRFGRAVVSTSANVSGEPAPGDFTAISNEIRAGVDLIIDPSLAKGATGRPSSIIALGVGGEIKIIRE
jgi:L-threonylcarbamoyladenylate synthase